MTRSGKRFYITFMDDYLRYKREYLLRNKDEVRYAFIKYKIEVENQLSKKIKRLRTDWEGKYKSNPFNSFCEDHKIIYETCPTYSPKRHDERNVVKFGSTLELVGGSHPLHLSYSKQDTLQEN